MFLYFNISISVQSGHGIVVRERIDEELPAAATKSDDLVTTDSVSASTFPKSASNGVGLYESGTASAEIGEESPSPNIDKPDLSASMFSTPTEVHHCGLIPVSSKDGKSNVQEGNSMELSAATGNDGGLTLDNVTPMEGCQSGLPFNTSEDKVIKTSLIIFELLAAGYL